MIEYIYDCQWKYKCDNLSDELWEPECGNEDESKWYCATHYHLKAMSDDPCCSFNCQEEDD